jgi:hypothetical protein
MVVFLDKGIIELLMAPGKLKREPHEPPCFGTRNLADNLSDLRAQEQTKTEFSHFDQKHTSLKISE